MFEYDASKVPDVKLEREWQLQDGTVNQVYRVGDWSFETSEEANVKYAQEAIYAWIAWHDFLYAHNQVEQNTKEHQDE